MKISFEKKYRMRVLWNRLRYFMAGCGLMIALAGILVHELVIVMSSIPFFTPMAISIYQDILWCQFWVKLVINKNIKCRG